MREAKDRPDLHPALHLHIINNQYSYEVQKGSVFKHRRIPCPSCNHHAVTKLGLEIHRRIFHKDSQ